MILYNRCTHPVRLLNRLTQDYYEFAIEGVAFRMSSDVRHLDIIETPDAEFNVSSSIYLVLEQLMLDRVDEKWKVSGTIPEPRKGTGYIVSANVKLYNPHRDDFYSPGAGVFERHMVHGQSQKFRTAASDLIGVLK